MMIIDNKYDFGQIVFLKTDDEQLPRLVLSFEVFKGGELIYKLGNGTTTSQHYEFEISEEKNLVNV